MTELTAISTWLDENTKYLKKAGVESAQLDCKILLEYVMKKNRTWLMAHGDEMLPKEQLQKLDYFITQRSQRVPLAYIIGSKEFYGREFYVDENVLIPRPESEVIIELLRDLLVIGRWSDAIHDTQLTIYDIGTGSGCLAITAKLEIPDAGVIATDISEAVLEVARKNAHNLGADISFVQSDLFSKIQDLKSNILLANLPYVPDGMVTSKEITSEPARALFSGQDGLNHYRTFWEQVDGLSSKPVYIFTESLEDQHKKMVSLAKEAGYQPHTSRDLIQVFIMA